MLLLIICFIMLSISIIITWMNPTEKYEISIFSSTPNIYWLSLLISLYVGFIIVIKFILSETEGNKICKNSALILLFIAFASFLSLWIIRGYYLWCSGDPLTHLGWIKDTILTGHINEDIIYPIAHIYLAQISTILNIDPILPHKYVPILFGLLFILFMYQFAKSVLPDKLSTTIVLLLSFIPMHGWYLNLTPNYLANLLLPLAFFILITYLKNRSYQWCILFLIMIFLYPAFHPVSSLALLVMIISLTPPVITFVKKTMDKLLSYNVHQTKNNRFIVFGILLVALIITWVSSFYVWDYTIRNLYSLATEGGPRHLDALIDEMQYASGYGYSVALQFFKVYGGRLIYMILMAIGCVLLWKKCKQDKNIYKQYRKLFYLIIPSLAFIVLVGLTYLTNVGFNAERIVFYIIIIAMLFVGYAIGELLKKVKTSLVCSTVSLFLAGLFIIAAPLVYPTPYTLEANWQITRSEITGMDWALHKRNDDAKLTGLTISQPGRFGDVLLLPEERFRVGIPRNIPEELRIPFHFGYDENDYLGDSYHENVYIVLTYKDRIFYKEVFPDVAHLRFLDDDFDKLNIDKSLTKLYENGEFENYYINSNLDGKTV